MIILPFLTRVLHFEGAKLDEEEDDNCGVGQRCRREVPRSVVSCCLRSTMPSISLISGLEKIFNDMNQLATIDWVHGQLRTDDDGRILVLDCRLQTDYANGHIRGAINVTLPSILLRRLASDKVSISSLIKCNESREIFLKNWKTHTVVLCGDETDPLMPNPVSPCGSTLPILYRKLQQDGCQVVYLQGKKRWVFYF